MSYDNPHQPPCNAGNDFGPAGDCVCGVDKLYRTQVTIDAVMSAPDQTSAQARADSIRSSLWGLVRSFAPPDMRPTIRIEVGRVVHVPKIDAYRQSNRVVQDVSGQVHPRED
jgi:hypothetical protein